jgi:hypothetical protein
MDLFCSVFVLDCNQLNCNSNFLQIYQKYRDLVQAEFDFIGNVINVCGSGAISCEMIETTAKWS